MRRALAVAVSDPISLAVSGATGSGGDVRGASAAARMPLLSAGVAGKGDGEEFISRSRTPRGA